MFGYRPDQERVSLAFYSVKGYRGRSACSEGAYCDRTAIKKEGKILFGAQKACSRSLVPRVLSAPQVISSSGAAALQGTGQPPYPGLDQATSNSRAISGSP